MQKMNNRKFAVTALAILVAGVLSACSGASSTDDALTVDQSVMGTYQFDVNPTASSVTVTPVGSPWSSTQIVGDGMGNIANVTVSTSGQSWNAGTGSLDFDVTLTWTHPTMDLWNARLEVNSSTNVNVTNENDDVCAGTWSGCLGGGTMPTITYVSDVQSEGPETKNICDGLGTCATMYRNSLNAGCGQVKAHWKLTEAAGTGYKFWASLYGDQAPIDPLADPRYSEDTATIFTRVRKLTYATTNNPPEGADSNSMLPNEWFYVHVYEDNPGNNRADTPYAAMDMSGGLYIGPKHIEDQTNVGFYTSVALSSSNYWYVGGWTPMTIRFDTAVIEVASNDPGGIPPTGGAKFCTAKGTRIQSPFDTSGTACTGVSDCMNSQAGTFVASNLTGTLKHLSAQMLAFAFGDGPNPCNNKVNGTACPAGSRDGFANRDWDIWRAAAHVKTTAVSGQGSPMFPSTDSMTLMNAYLTMATPYDTTDLGAGVPHALTWPNWCETLPNGICWAGAYNLERSYVCVQ